MFRVKGCYILRVRAKPSLNAPVIGGIQVGGIIKNPKVINSSWLMFYNDKGEKGFVLRDYLEEVADE